MSAWTLATVVERRDWADQLATITLDADIDPFDPGQWVNLALEVGGDMVRRAYSIASRPGAPLEFFLTCVEGGAFTPSLFQLPIGGTLQVERKAQGFFTLRYVPEARDLWMVATGTGLGPFMSMLRSEEVWRRFERIVLIHGVRKAEQLAYAEELAGLSRDHGDKLVRVPVVSRETTPEALAGRVTHVLDTGELEQRAGVEISAEHSHLMLCGNPDMIRDMTDALKARGLERHRVKKPGHITIEKYW